MRTLALFACLGAAMFATSPASAEEPDSALAVIVGGATLVAGFAVGGTLMAAAGGNPGPSEAGWFLLESGFTLAPLTSHAVVGEWGRGALFATVPTATTLGTIPVFLGDPDAIIHGSLPEQRWMWALFVSGLAASTVGVIDTTYAPSRQLHVMPVVGTGQAGLVFAGTL